MPVSDRFSELIERITPTQAEAEAYGRHFRTVSGAVANALRTNRVEAIGSFSRNTAVSGVSDLDLLVVLSAKEGRWGDTNVSSHTVLKNVRNALRGRLHETDVVIDANAVVVHFSQGQRPVDVVPGFYVGPARAFRNYPVFRIPDGFGGWLDTSPHAHAAYLKESTQRSRGKLPRLAQLAKWWASRHSHVSVTSFHLEILIAAFGLCDQPISYADALGQLFAVMRKRQARGIRDPLGISGVIPAAKSESARERLLASISKAADHSAVALQAEASRNTPEAVRQWRIAFNHSSFSR